MCRSGVSMLAHENSLQKYCIRLLRLGQDRGARARRCRTRRSTVPYERVRPLERPENRVKSRSVVQIVAPCSSATAARTASMTSGPAVWPYVRDRADPPVALARFENALVAGRASQEEIAASASDVDSGRSNSRGFVVIRRKAHSVSHAKRTSTGPRASLRATPGFSRAARLSDDRRRAAGWRRRGSPMKRALDLLDEPGDIVQGSPGRRSPRSRTTILKASPLRWYVGRASPRRSVSLTIARNGRWRGAPPP